MRGEPGEYDCLLCDQPLESFSGETYVACRLTVSGLTIASASRTPSR
jgi:hypothetical protein